jgi:hypothetical protein
MTDGAVVPLLSARFAQWPRTFGHLKCTRLLFTEGGLVSFDGTRVGKTLFFLKWEPRQITRIGSGYD